MTRHLQPHELERYLSGSTASADAERVESHLSACARCRSTFESARSLVRATNALPTTADPGADLWPRISGAIHPPTESQTAMGWIERFRAGMRYRRAAVAVALAAVVVVTILLWRGGYWAASDSNAPAEARVAQLLAQDAVWYRLEGVQLAARLDHVSGEIVASLVQSLRHDSNVNVRIGAALALQQHAEGTAFEDDVYDAFLVQGSAVVQMEILSEIRSRNVERAVPTLREKLTDESLQAGVREAIELVIAELER